MQKDGSSPESIGNPELGKAYGITVLEDNTEGNRNAGKTWCKNIKS